MALKHDAQGFLVGDPIDIGRALTVWDDIRSDVRAIRKAVIGASEASSKGISKHSPASSVRGPRGGMEEADPAVKASARRSERATPAIPARRYGDEIPALLRKAVIPVRGQPDKEAQATAKYGVAETIARPARKTAQAVAKPAGRDGRGRFTKGGDRPDGSAPGETKDGADEGALRSIADRIVGAVVDSSGGMEEADPAVKAFQEVAQPMARGYEFMTGGSDDKKQVGFLRRIFGTLNAFRKEEGVFNKAANRSLKNLEAKPEGGEGGNGGFWGTILSAIMGIGPAILAGIGALLSKIPFFGPKIGGAGAGGVGAGAAGGAGGAAKAGGGFFKGALKKIPLLGALLAVGGAAADIYGSENDDKLSRREKDKNAGKAVGGAGGTIAGMAAGAAAGAFAGPIGMAIGGMVGAFLGDQAGQIIGDTVGGWVNDLRNADIAGAITGAWDSVTSMVKSGWDSVVSGFTTVSETIGKGWDAIKGGFDNLVSGIGAIWDSFSGFLKEKFGIDIPGILKPVVDAGKKVVGVVVDTAAAAKQKAVEVGTKAVEKGKEVAQATKEKAVEVGAKAAERVQQGAEYVANNTTVGKGIKATGEAVRYGTDVAVDVAKSAKSRITGKASENKAALVSQMAASGITDPKEQAMFMAQMDHESGGFTKMEERFNYRSADRLMAVSGSARKLGKPAVEAAMAQGPEAVAEAMYGGRMGNKNPGDAYAFRGRGHVQLTGRDNYTAAGKALGLDLANNPDLAAEPENAAKIAAWYWKRNPKLATAAKQGDVEGATQVINGGQNGIAHRKELFAQYSAESSKGSLTAGATPPAISTTAATIAAKPVSVASPAAPVVASISAPPVSVAPTAPTIAEAPPVAVPMASADTKKVAAVSPPTQEAGQDLKDRRIAHIVTGGLSST